MRAVRLTATLVCVYAVAVWPARAARANQLDPAEQAVPLEEEGLDEPEAPPPGRVACLDDLSAEGYQRKGVQKRDFLKRMKFEISAVGGFYASDVLSSTYTVGGALAFFPAEDLGLELLVSWSPVALPPGGALHLRSTGPAASSPGSALQAVGGLLFSPFHAKFKVTEADHPARRSVPGGRGGPHLPRSVQGVTFQGGLGLRLYLLQRLAFRLDVRDFVLPQEVLGRARVTHNLTVLAGLRHMARLRRSDVARGLDWGSGWRWCWPGRWRRGPPGRTTRRTRRSASTTT